jgi:plastocyanin
VTKNLLFVAPLLVTAALAVGCGDGGSDTATNASTPAAAKTAAAVTETKTTQVKMAGSTFAPGSIDLEVGDTVTFVNDDEIAHTATSDAFDSGTMDPGATFDFTASKAGTISYLCSFHPGMTGTINVT